MEGGTVFGHRPASDRPPGHRNPAPTACEAPGDSEVRNDMSKHFAVPALVAALALQANAQSTSTSTIGSLVGGERPYYLEIDSFADDSPFTVKFMNVPAGATNVTLYISPKIVVTKHSDATAPGNFGIDLAGAQVISLGTKTTHSGTVDGARWNGPCFIQGYFKLPAGGRLTSLVEVHPDDALGSPPPPSVSFPIPLLTQEVLRPGKKGVDRSQQTVRVGIPLPKGQVFEKAGIP